MVLHVPFDEFPAAVRRVLSVEETYVQASGARALASASDGTKIVEALSPFSPDETKARLREAGLAVFSGYWGDDASEAISTELYVGAVAYMSGEGRPGLWVEAFEQAPAHSQVAHAMYEEFMANGEMMDVSFEQFMDRAKATVVVVSPEELRRFARARSESEPR